MIEVKALQKHYKEVRAVDGISFTARDGEILGLLGPNGAGKTTTLRLLATTIQPTSGTAQIDKYDLLESPIEVRASLGVLPEYWGLYGRLTARENLRYYGRLYGLVDNGLEEQINQIIEKLEMREFVDRRVEPFSKGMKQRVAIGRALLHDPPNLLLDEPTAGLDVISSRQVRALVKELRDDGKCIIFSTHLLPEAEKVCDRIAIIHRGKIAATGTPQSLCEQTGESSLEEAFVKVVGFIPEEVVA